MPYRLTRTAQDALDAVLFESARTHGLAAAERYGRLLFAAFAMLGERPTTPGSAAVVGLDGVRAYPTRLARHLVGASRRVGRPRHLVVYRVAPDGVVEVLGLAHDRMILSRAAARLAADAGEP